MSLNAYLMTNEIIYRYINIFRDREIGRQKTWKNRGRRRNRNLNAVFGIYYVLL